MALQRGIEKGTGFLATLLRRKSPRARESSEALVTRETATLSKVMRDVMSGGFLLIDIDGSLKTVHVGLKNYANGSRYNVFGIFHEIGEMHGVLINARDDVSSPIPKRTLIGDIEAHASFKGRTSSDNSGWRGKIVTEVTVSNGRPLTAGERLQFLSELTSATVDTEATQNQFGRESSGRFPVYWVRDWVRNESEDAPTSTVFELSPSSADSR